MSITRLGISTSPDSQNKKINFLQNNTRILCVFLFFYFQIIFLKNIKSVPCVTEKVDFSSTRILKNVITLRKGVTHHTSDYSINFLRDFVLLTALARSKLIYDKLGNVRGHFVLY